MTAADPSAFRPPGAACSACGPRAGACRRGPRSAKSGREPPAISCVSRSVRDTALALDVLSGPACGDPYVIAPPEKPYVELAAREPGRLRIAFCTASPMGSEVHPEAVAAVKHAAELLTSLGHDVVEDRPQYDGIALARCYLELYFGQVAATLAEARAAGADECRLRARHAAARSARQGLQRRGLCAQPPALERVCPRPGRVSSTL